MNALRVLVEWFQDVLNPQSKAAAAARNPAPPQPFSNDDLRRLEEEVRAAYEHRQAPGAR